MYFPAAMRHQIGSKLSRSALFLTPHPSFLSPSLPAAFLFSVSPIFLYPFPFALPFFTLPTSHPFTRLLLSGFLSCRHLPWTIIFSWLFIMSLSGPDLYELFLFLAEQGPTSLGPHILKSNFFGSSKNFSHITVTSLHCSPRPRIDFKTAQQIHYYSIRCSHFLLTCIVFILVNALHP